MLFILMKGATRRGLSFGLTSGVITTLGVIIGLDSSTESKLAVVGGILTVAIADAFSDALGMHNSQESVKGNGRGAIWSATFATFFAKFFVGLSFLVPFLFFELSRAVVVDVILGAVLLIIFTYNVSKVRGTNFLTEIIKHLFFAGVVMVITYYVGVGIRMWFG